MSFEGPDLSEIWQASRQRYYREACQIVERCGHFYVESRDFVRSGVKMYKRITAYIIRVGAGLLKNIDQSATYYIYHALAHLDTEFMQIPIHLHVATSALQHPFISPASWWQYTAALHDHGDCLHTHQVMTTSKPANISHSVRACVGNWLLQYPFPPQHNPCHIDIIE